MKRLLSLLVFLLPSMVYGQGPSNAQIEAAKGIVKLYTTAGLPATCAPGQRVWDTTANATKVCANDGVTWSSISFTGGTITSPILAPAANNCAAVPYSFSGDTTTGMCSDASGQVAFYISNSRKAYLNTTLFAAPAFTWLGNSSIYSPSVGVLWQRESGAQEYHWAYSYTDASSYQGGVLKTSASGIEIAAETAGSGADDLDITLTPAGTGVVSMNGGSLAVGASTVVLNSLLYPRTLALTPATMNNEIGDYYSASRTTTSSFAWTNAMVVALGAATAGDITVATLPAKTQVLDALLVITGTAAGTTTLTVSCGDANGGTPFTDYIGVSDAKAAANTVYGDTAGERGASMTGYYLPSYTTTKLVTCHFISTGANLDQVTGSTGRVILTTRLLP